MNLHQSPEVCETASLAEASMEVLYATERFQARLWHLQAEQELKNFPFVAKGTVTESQCLLMKGQLTLKGPDRISTPTRGQRFLLNPKTPHELRAETPVMLLELLWGEQLEALPLKEITEERPWGSFTVLKDEPEYKLKELLVKPGSRLSLQRHFKREEHWLVTQGTPAVTLDDKTHDLKAGEYIHIPLQSWHRISNPEGATEAVEIIELQLGDYFGEDDIERQQDDYGRQ